MPRSPAWPACRRRHAIVTLSSARSPSCAPRCPAAPPRLSRAPFLSHTRAQPRDLLLRPRIPEAPLSDRRRRLQSLSAKGEHYSADFPGLQYFGKGGTSLNPFKNLKAHRTLDKLTINVRNQSKLMSKAAATGNEEVISMMYWTTTGAFASIRNRNDGMWDDLGKSKLRQLWESRLGDFVDEQVALTSPNPLAEAQHRLGFSPNIVMIDFADAPKCEAIHALNSLAAHALVGVDG